MRNIGWITLSLTPLLWGCIGGGGSGPSLPPISAVLISPGSTTVPAGGSKTFLAMAQDASGNLIAGIQFSWSVVGGPVNGTIDSATGQYTAPALIPEPNSVIIEAAVASDPTKKGSATVDIISGLSPVFLNNVFVPTAVPTVDTGSSGQHSTAVLGNQVFIVWSDDSGASGGYNVYLARSFDRGQTFVAEPAVNYDPILNLPCSETGSSKPCQASLAVDSQGNAYIAWQDFRNHNFNIYFSICRANQNQCDPNVQIARNDLIVQQFPTIAVTPAGNRIVIAWQENGVAIKAAYSTNGGISFSSPATVNDSASSTPVRQFPSMAIGPSGNVNIAWRDERNQPALADIFYARSTDGGNTFLPNVIVNDVPGNAQSNPSLAVDLSGNIDVVWQDSRNGNADIFFAKSVDGGKSFLPNLRLNDDTGAANQGRPTLALDPYGDILVAWEDERRCFPLSSCGASGPVDIYFIKSIDGGSSFGLNILVNNDSSATPKSG
ncbi:MAG TPA: hypothetical protein VFG95_05960, partial [Nitrospiria bacterium]|nr:hypothetical protein [Nitrospiria bacterium]